MNENKPDKKGIGRKKLVIILIASILTLTLFYVAITVIPYIIDKNKKDKKEEITIDYDFYPADYSENIYEDEKYLKLIEYGPIEYHHGGLITYLNKDNASEEEEVVRFFVDYIYSIIEGNAEKYNSFFSEKYYESASQKNYFTMQKLYNIKLEQYSSETVGEDGKNYTKYIYTLSYNIYQNNGTFRADIGEGSRTQYIVLTDSNGKLLIDAINYLRYN